MSFPIHCCGPRGLFERTGWRSGRSVERLTVGFLAQRCWICVCAAEPGSGCGMTDRKGLTCHIAFDFLSLEQDKREAKCQVIRVTHPHMHTQTETERDECFIIKAQTHQAFSRYKQKAYRSREDNSHQWHLQCVSATGFSCAFLQVCLFLLLGPCKPSDLLAERGLCPAGGGGGKM